MNKEISESHPLRRLFLNLTEKNFFERLGWPDKDVIRYISNLLADFTYTENIYKIRSMKGKRMEEVGEMLMEAEVSGGAGFIDREREIHKHIGDYTLFMAGIFPEYLEHIKSARLIYHKDFLLDYVKVGKRSYRIVTKFQYGSFQQTTPLFRKLSDNFELCILGLGGIREDLERIKDEKYLNIRRLFLN